MGKVVKLNLEHGDFSQGFQITLEISDDSFPHRQIRTGGSLPANLQVWANYDNWQKTYRRLETAFRRPVILDDETELLPPVSADECQVLFETLKGSINHWLSAEEFRRVKEQLLRELDEEEEIRVIVRTSEYNLRKLPWDAWEFLDEFPNAAVAISPTEHDVGNPVKPKSKVRILAILGNSQGINIARDRGLLENLPQADVRFLVEPQRQEFETLWSEEWDILFFAGHSYSQGDGDCGYIYINQTEKLAISELKNTLKRAIKKGLQLAIFNSCDGLGLANELQRLNIPQMIVMREPVPDKFAQEFLKYFLESFSSGKSLYSSVREAREKLHDLSDIERRFPGASLLPVICQNPTVLPVKWENFLAKAKPETESGESIEPPVLSEDKETLAKQISLKKSANGDKSLKVSPPAKKPMGKLIAIGLLGGAICLSAISGWLWWKRPICSLSDSRIPLMINIPQGQLFNYGGSTTWVPIAQPFHEQLKTALPDFNLNPPKYSGSVEGIQQVLGGYFAFSLSSIHLQKKDLAEARQQGYELIQKSVGIDAIAVGVNPQLNVPSLTLTQLKDIYIGKIRNWQQVGGSDLPITPYSRQSDQGGTVRFFTDAVLGGQPFNTQIVQFVSSTTTGIGKVSNDPGGIYYASAPELVSQCGIRPLPLGLPGKAPIAPYQGDLVPLESCPQQRNEINFAGFKSGEYPLTRNLFVIIKDFPGENNTQEQAGRAYTNLILTGKGQGMVKEPGYVPIVQACPSP
ncbi:MAG: substrate-binding domain-containing protein [Coleofasciculus sp. G3-WIS-01]|uniref:substrate-binding domain-containing protein n=1 Tax=Coleofasciculus sp. G3-WIS-01 TaxID=3069528 RepID=UPI0032FD1E38